MTESTDWYPRTLEGEREMYQAIFANFDDVNIKLKASDEVATRIKAIAQIFLAYDENLRLNEAAVEALSKAFKAIRTGKKGVDSMPLTPTFHDLVIPAGDFVGIETEMREIRRYLKGLFTWTDNMGDILKMNGKEATTRNENEMSPSVKIKQVVDVSIYVSTKKEGMDGVEYQWRIAGTEDWKFLKNSGETDDILEIPLAEGSAQKIELRAHFLKKFKRVGIWSPTYNLIIGK